MEHLYHLLLFIPCAIAALWALDEKVRKKHWIAAVTVLGMILGYSFNVFEQTLFFANKNIADWIATLNIFAMCALIPMNYLYITKICGHSLNSWGTYVVTLIIPLAFLPNLNIHLGGSLISANDVNLAHQHALNIFQDGQLVYSMNLANIICIIQGFVATFYILAANHDMRRYELVLSRRAKLAIWWWITTYSMVLFMMLAPEKWIHNLWFYWAYFSGYTFVATCFFLQMALNFDENPILAKGSGEATGFDEFLDKHKELAIETKFLLEHEELFKDPEINLDIMAKKLGTNRSYMARVMKAEYEMTFSEFVTSARVAYAQKQLLSTNKTIEDIAQDSGFKDATALHRAFKKIENDTPDHWRKAHLNERISRFTFTKK